MEGLVAAPPAHDQSTAKPEDSSLSWEKSVDRLKKLAQESASRSASDQGSVVHWATPYRQATHSPVCLRNSSRLVL
jgi:hypothetical protein